MDSKYIEELKLLDNYYWWHVSKRKTIIGLMGGCGSLKARKVLELGFGSAALLVELQRLGAECWGVDSADAAVEFAQAAGMKNVFKADLQQQAPAELQAGYFDYIVMADVLEHVDGDMEFLKKIEVYLKPCGKIIISVPAFGLLWSYWDEALGHKRRYTVRSLQKAVENAGLTPAVISYYYMAAFFPAFFMRLFKRFLKTKSKTEFFSVPRFLNGLFIKICDIERVLMARTGLPVGLSVYCLAEKR